MLKGLKGQFSINFTIWILVFIIATGSWFWYSVLFKDGDNPILKSLIRPTTQSYEVVASFPTLKQLDVVDLANGPYLRIAINTPNDTDASEKAFLDDMISIYKWGEEASGANVVIWTLNEIEIPKVSGGDVEVYQVMTIFWLGGSHVEELFLTPISALVFVDLHREIMVDTQGIEGGVLTPEKTEIFLGFKNIPW